LGASVDRTGVALVAALIALAGLGWMITDERMAGMDAGPGSDPVRSASSSPSGS
jgi:hypothetical protein